ncbi:MAG: SRPBCC family protein [Gemmatimonadaceae bacterium]
MTAVSAREELETTMTKPSVTHATYVIERTYPVSPARTFDAFSDPEKKRRWFAGYRAPAGDFEMDFRVGGRERTRSIIDGGPHKGTVLTNETVYQDIVPDKRIVFAYSMLLGDRRISASLVTVELIPKGDGTSLIFTDQGAYFEGADGVEMRRQGWEQIIDRLEKETR